jgi:hypothetical protein
MIAGRRARSHGRRYEEFITSLGGAAVARPLAAQAPKPAPQQPDGCGGLGIVILSTNNAEARIGSKEVIYEATRFHPIHWWRNYRGTVRRCVSL